MVPGEHNGKKANRFTRCQYFFYNRDWLQFPAAISRSVATLGRTCCPPLSSVPSHPEGIILSQDPTSDSCLLRATNQPYRRVRWEEYSPPIPFWVTTLAAAVGQVLCGEVGNCIIHLGIFGYINSWAPFAMFSSRTVPLSCMRHRTVLMERCHVDRIPQESLDAIIDELENDRRDLEACCLVSRRWLWRSRTHIFRKIRFSSLRGSKSLHNWSKAMNVNGTDIIVLESPPTYERLCRYPRYAHQVSSYVTA